MTAMLPILAAAAIISGILGPVEVSQFSKAEYSVYVSGGSWTNACLQEEAAVDMEFIFFSRYFYFFSIFY